MTRKQFRKEDIESGGAEQGLPVHRRPPLAVATPSSMQS